VWGRGLGEGRMERVRGGGVKKIAKGAGGVGVRRRVGGGGEGEVRERE